MGWVEGHNIMVSVLTDGAGMMRAFLSWLFNLIEARYILLVI